MWDVMSTVSNSNDCIPLDDDSVCIIHETVIFPDQPDKIRGRYDLLVVQRNETR